MYFDTCSHTHSSKGLTLYSTLSNCTTQLKGSKRSYTIFILYCSLRWLVIIKIVNVSDQSLVEITFAFSAATVPITTVQTINGQQLGTLICYHCWVRVGLNKFHNSFSSNHMFFNLCQTGSGQGWQHWQAQWRNSCSSVRTFCSSLLINNYHLTPHIRKGLVVMLVRR